jgi:hypothetical protein
MAKKSKSPNAWLQTNAVRLTRIHFIYVAFFLLSVVIFDASNLYTYKAITELWTAGVSLLALNVIIWFAARFKVSNYWYYTALAGLLILADILFATYLIWIERGLYSKDVMLYAVPIIASATLRSRSIVFATATLCAAAYSTTAVRYFFQNYGLGYKVELWSTVGFFSAMMFVLAFLLMVIIRPTEEKF